MVNKIRIIMPCGGAISDVDLTMESVVEVAKALDYLEFIVYRVFNNGLSPSCCRSIENDDVKFFDLDINPVASVALARNRALDEIETQLDPTSVEHDFIIFLDSGDLLLDGLVREIPFYFPQADLLVGSTIVSTTKNEYKRRNVPLFLKHVVNPIYLGSAIIKTVPAISQRFVDGRREDWKFWLQVVSGELTISRASACNYVYKVKSRGNHLHRKRKLLRHQFSFYRNYLGFSFLSSCGLLFSHYFLVSLIWGLILPFSKTKRDHNAS